MRTSVVVALALHATPAALVAQEQGDTLSAAVTPRPVAARRDTARVSGSTRRARLCDRLDVIEHYTDRPAIIGAVIGAVGGTVWAVHMSSGNDATLAAPMFFLIGPTMGASYGLGAGALTGLGKWGWDHAHGNTWRSGARVRARRQGLLCEGVPPATASAQGSKEMRSAPVVAILDSPSTSHERD